MSKVLLAVEEFSESNEIQSVLKRAGLNVLSISNEYLLSEQILSFNPDLVLASGRGAKISTVGVGKRLKEMPRWTGRTVLIFPQGQAASPQDLAKLRMDMALESPVETTRLIQVIAQLLGLNERVLLERALKAQHADSQTKESPVFVGGGNQFEPSWNVKGGAGDVEQFNRLFGGAAGAQPEVFPESSRNQEPSSPESFNVGGEKPSQDVEALASAKARAAEELEKIHSGEKERISKYDSFLGGLTLKPESTMNKVQARKVQKALADHWDKAAIENQDALRQEFAREMFKKKN